MSFSSLIKSCPSRGKIKIKGGQTQGNVEQSKESIAVKKYTPSACKGIEYAVEFQTEDNKTSFESNQSTNFDVGRIDVTNGEVPSKMFEAEELTSVGTVSNLQEITREELTQVYENYDCTPVKPSEQLEAIHSEREEILKMIQVGQVCIIKGQTGCGKSTQIPQFILDSHMSRREHCNIIVTQPRRIAAIALSQHVCEQRNWSLGDLVGYQVALDKKATENTRLLYCTTGVLLEKLINAKHMNDYTHILLDEVHEREEDMDLTMLFVKRFLRTNSSWVKVILMSATMDVTRFRDYFEVIYENEKYPAPYYEINKTSPFSVQVYYLDSLNIGDIPKISEDEPGIAKEGYMLVPKMIKAFNTIDDEDYKHKRSNEEKGAVLIFLPGLYQIETLYEILSNEDKMMPDVFNLWLCPLHSSITKDEQEKVRRYAPPGKRKVILSTNIAESSLTIPDVKFVIDFCLTKHLVADPVTGFTSLQLAWASHTNCIQREGRAGRVQDGRVYRIVPKNFYKFKMAKECVPEMQRCPLEIIVLKCKKLIEDECPLKLIACALDPPDLDNYEKTILKLKEVGALLTTCRGKLDPLDGDLTFVGQVMASLPLDIHITKLILLGHAFDVLEEAIIMGCAMSVRNIFSEPFQKRLDAYNNKLLWADSSESDSVAYLNAYMVWRHMTGLGKFNRSVGSEDAWARRYMLQIKHLREVAKQEDDIKKRIKQFNIQVVRQKGKPLWGPAEKPLILKLVLAGAFYPHYFMRNAQNPNAESEAVKMLAGNSPYNSVYLQNMPHPAPLYLNQIKESLRRNGISDDVELYHDDTRKLVVKFNQGKSLAEQEISGKNLHMNIPGEIVMPVYRAVKLRQLNVPISIKLYPVRRVKEELMKLSRHSSSSMLSVAESVYKPQISLTQHYVEIEISHVENAGHFYGHIVPSNEKLFHIYQLLNCYEATQPVYGQVIEGMIYIAPFKEEADEDFHYYRARVKRKYTIQNILCVDVFFIDYGNSSRKLLASELREAVSEETKQELNAIEPCALECVLAEVCPSVWSPLGGQWSDSANKFVTQTLLNKTWGTKIYSYINDVASVHLYLTYSNMASEIEPLTLNDELVNRGFAMHKEESYFSKLNHAKRVEIEKKGELNSSASGTDNADSLQRSLAGKNLFSLPTTTYRDLIDLKGPNSPLEMKLFSVVHCSTQKEVKVEWNSVNSVLLDSDPTDNHERLLVAGSVSQSTDGRKLTLNHTTVLPNMHGLAALICLIFAPCIELRTDDNFSRYTGALCGLGMGQGVSLFRENDMEINFDVEFTNDDILEVNKLRYWINERYCNDYALDTPDSQIIKIQNNIRHFAISLLRRVRPTVRVYYNPCQFLWGKVPEDRLFHPFRDVDASDFSRFIYQLHRGIDLNPENDRLEIEDFFKKLINLENTLAANLSPRYNYCDLCDLNFDYVPMLRLHLTSSHHIQLKEWLKSRATAHGLDVKQMLSNQ